MNLRTPFVIISAERAEFDEPINSLRTESLRRDLQELGVDPIPVSGQWNGVPEQSFFVVLPFGDSMAGGYDDILRLGREYEQDAVLYVDGSRIAYLDGPEGGAPDLIGKWRELDPSEPEPENGLTVFPDGRRFAVD